ncbi:hypothetical protein FHR22_000440 [Sphingopyxis panaciterrae]|nr:hypothetical protein [Sphingopyxis panaciterrae]
MDLETSFQPSLVIRGGDPWFVRLDQGSRFLGHCHFSTSSGTPDQVRGDEEWNVRNRSLAVVQDALAAFICCA